MIRGLLFSLAVGVAWWAWDPWAAFAATSTGIAAAFIAWLPKEVERGS
ncbi:hypothetical protein phiMa_11 [Thermus phage phiMa]|nr:hypothetical protein phiMa_11 [Thermus phage phiMa]